MVPIDEALSLIREAWTSNADFLKDIEERLVQPGAIPFVPFVGAGISVPMGLPAWTNFLTGLAAECGKSNEIAALLADGSYEVAAGTVEAALGPTLFNRRIAQTFGKRTSDNSELRGAVVALPELAQGAVVTTNFDRILERVFREAGTPFNQIVWGAQVDSIGRAIADNRHSLLKIHGDAEERTGRVLTKSEYDSRYGTGDPDGLRAQLGRIFQGRTLLFVGCSLGADRTMDVLAEALRTTSGLEHFAVVEMPGAPDDFFKKQTHLGTRGILPIWYPTGRHDLIEPLLRWIASLQAPPRVELIREDAEIPFPVLHRMSQSLVPRQVEAVGGGKYIPSLYVARSAEKEVAEFVAADERFLARATEIADDLRTAANEYQFGDGAIAACDEIIACGRASHDGQRCERMLAELRRALHFSAVTSAKADFDRLILSGGDPVEVNQFLNTARKQPFVMQSELRQILPTISHILQARSADPGRPLTALAAYRGALRIFPAVVKNEVVIPTNDLIVELTGMAETIARRCLAVVDRAGAGKTNLLCRVAEQLSGKEAVVLLGAQPDGEQDPERWLQRVFELEFGREMVNWLPRAAKGLETGGRWLYVILDGLNESGQPRVLAAALRRFAARLTGRRIKLLVSYRDLFWDVFNPEVSPYLFKPAIKLHDFNDAEWSQALLQYFAEFRITARLQPDAEKALRNPLILRFFCVANQGRDLGVVTSLDLSGVFDLYLTRTSAGIASRLGHLDTEPAVAMLARAADLMWRKRQTSLDITSLGVTPEAAASPGSIYAMIRSENMLLQESRTPGASRKFVRFVYDEFMEYMLARSWQSGMADAEDAAQAQRELLKEIASVAPIFPACLGALAFLDILQSSEGRLIREAVRQASTQRLRASEGQAMALYLLERMAADQIDDDVVALVEELKRTAPPDSRDRVAQIIIRFAAQNKEKPALRRMVKQILELDHDAAGPQSPLDRPSGKGAAAATTRPPTPVDLAPRPLSLDEYIRRRDAAAEKDKRFLVGSYPNRREHGGRLPPARQQYSEETKLNAIALLADSPGDYELVEHAIRKLGRQDLDAALRALKAIDNSEPEMVYRTVRSYLKSTHSEYHVYCAWLLRNRYGPTAAGFLLELLTSEHTRVHRYALRIFDTRQIEHELVEAILLRATRNPQLQPWHLRNVMALLGRPQSLRTPDRVDLPGVVKCLQSLRHHALPSVRAAAFEALLKYPALIDRDVLFESVLRDSDPYVRAAGTLLMAGRSGV